MCGIAGWFAKPDEQWRPTQKQVAEMLEDIEFRGRDATGYGTLKDDGNLWGWKGPITAKEFNKAMLEEGMPIGRVGILHTRGASVGEPSDNRNNHPLPYKYQDRTVLVVHNGGIGNLEEAYKKLKIDPPAEVDSALFAAALAIKGPKDGLEFMSQNSGGSAAIAALYKGGTLVLAKDGNPLFLAQVAPGAFVWSSCEFLVKRMSVDFTFGIPMFRHNEFKSQHAVVWGEDGAVLWQGDWRLPHMYKPPKFLRWEREERERLARGVDGGSLGEKQDTKITAETSVLAETAKSKAETKKSEEDAKLRALPLAPAQAGSKPVAIPKEMEVRCFWNGCKKLARESVPSQVGGLLRFVALCHKHGTKVTKKDQAIVIERSGEVILKKQGRMTGGVPFAGQ